MEVFEFWSFVIGYAIGVLFAVLAGKATTGHWPWEPHEVWVKK